MMLTHKCFAIWVVCALMVLASLKVANAFDVELYGQLHKGFMVFDDGSTTRGNIVDNSVSSTRFGFRAEEEVNHGLVASFLLEMQSNGNSSVGLSQFNSVTDTQASSLGTRHARVGLGGRWGAIFAGQTSSATDGITEINLGAVADVFTSSAGHLAGGLRFRQRGGGLTTIRLNQVTDGFDGIDFGGGSASDGTDRFGAGFGDRANLVKYVSPKVKNTQLSFAYVQGEDFDMALRYRNRYDPLGLEVALGAGYVRYRASAALGQNEIKAQYSGALSMKHDIGLAFTTALGTRAYSQRAVGIDQPWFLYTKISQELGHWGFALDYGRYDSIDTTFAGKSVADVYGLGVQRSLVPGVSVAAYGRLHDLERSGIQTHTLQVYGVNMRVKF